ncbi:phage tail sheath family protein [Oscillospiraceae bacterium 44-5]
MALGGGTWLVQNKVLPGSYINFSSVAKASATLSDRGYAAAPFVLSWGPENEVFAVTSGEFQKNSKAIFGYSYDHPKMLALREIFLHATTVYCYRLGLRAKKAACALATAKYPGIRGNDLSIVIAANVDDPDAFDVGTYLDGIQVDLQTVTKAEELTGNDYVDFKKDLTLEATAGAPLTGGEDVANITGDSHQAFLDKIEAYAFNAMCCPAADPIIVKLYAAYCQRVRDEVGAKFQLIAWKPSTVDYEGVIGVWNSATHPSMEVDEHAVVYWATGAHAGVAVNKSLTNAKYDGELTLDTDYKQAELTAALKAGKFMFHNVNGLTRVLEDINTLLTLSDTKGEVFQSNQTMRVCDQIANDVAVLFNERYLGTVPNDASGRSALWGDITHYIKQLEDIRAVENFDPDTVSCEQGDKKKAVLVTVNGLNIINAMAQLYMSVVIQ